MPAILKVSEPELGFRKGPIGLKDSFGEGAGCALEVGR